MLKWILVAGGALVVLGLTLLAALPLLIDTPRMQAYIAQAASQALGRPVRFASIEVSAFPLPGLRLRGLRVAEDPQFGTTPFLTVEEGSIGIRLAPLLSRRVELADLRLTAPRIEVVEDKGRWNLATLGAPGPTSRAVPRGGSGGMGAAAGGMTISRVEIVNGTVHYQKRGQKGTELRLENINLTLSGVGAANGLQITGHAVANPGGLKLTVSGVTVALESGRPLGDAAVKGSVAVEATDVATLSAALLPSPGLSGPLQGKLSLSGTASRLAASGDLRLDRLTVSESRPQCPPPAVRQLPLQDVRVPLAYSPVRLDSAPLVAKVSRGTASLRLGVTWEAPLLVTLKEIRVKGVELGPVLVDYLCQPYAITGPLDLDGETAMRADDVLRTMNGSGRFRIGPGKVVGSEALDFLGDVARLAGAVSSVLRPEGRGSSSSSALDFQSITATYRITNGVVKTDDLLYQSPGMTLAAAGSYGLVDTRVDAELTLTQGRSQVRAKVVGTTSPRSLRVTPTSIRVPDSGGVRRLLDKLLR